MLTQGYFKGQRSRINHKFQLFMNMQSSSGNYSMRHQVPMVFLLLLIYLSAAACISGGTTFGRMLAQEYLKGQNCKKKKKKEFRK